MKCKSWYLSTPINEVIAIDKNNLNLPACPCNELAARNSPIWITYSSAQQDGHCYDLLPNYGEFGRRCCYRLSGIYIFETTKPQAGSLQRYNAFDSFMFKSKSHQINDLDPKQWCCSQSNLCELYYKLRPAGSCIASNWVRGFLFGDPHIVTLDQKPYIFNGLGEYKILEIKSNTNVANFIMQGRTCKAINNNGTEINATAWCAFAVKNGNNNILRVEISSSGKIMIIYASYENKSRDYSAQYQEPDFIAIENGMVLRKQNNSLEVAFPDSIGLSVSLNLGMLEFSVTLDKKYQNSTRGLLGNFNNIQTDDFICQNGTRLPDNSTERVLYQFGQSWAITQNESLFLYGYGQNTFTFSDPSFIPMFFDEQSTEAKSAAEAACGAYNIPCLFDFIATRNQEIAKKSLNSADTFKNESTSTANQAPTVTLITQQIRIIYNQSFSITINGSDIDGQIAEFKVFSDVSYKEKQRYTREAALSTLTTFEFFANTMGLIQIGFSGVDDKSLCSEVAQVNITCCTNCNFNGKCLENVLRKTNNPYFSYEVCNCDLGYTGVDCDQDVDGCVGNPCPTACIDAPASQQQVTGTAYTCTNCPAGYLLNQNKTKCEDVDECKNISSCDSNMSVCENVIGSFKCNCKPGYRNFNATRCLDINECTERLHNCDQICVNTLGSFNCTCLPGFNRKSGKCERTETDPCKLMNKNCSFNCRNSTNGPECFCPSGFQLKKTDNVSCEDIDECKENYCSQICHNSIGTFNCSCFNGYSLNSNDNRSCDACVGNKYGENCKSTCQCKGRAIGCDNVKGCICQNNWKGTECDVDVNECLKPNMCLPDHYCTNTIGSYSCDCPAGYEDINGTCVNINECSNPLLNNCTQLCFDTLGSFVCECDNGYTKLSNGTCQDVNECANDASGCQQICVNVVGSSFCECAVGYKLEDNRKTCVKEVLDPCINFYLNCSFGCTIVDDEAQCFCGNGYVLSTNKYDCIDVDECNANISQCSQSCENAPGTYKCSCQIGFKLQNDKTTCLQCDGYHWGENCATTCNCSTMGTERCDSIEGCKCKNGWSGKWCEKDQDECSYLNFPCPSNSKCTNTPGSYDCQCFDGFVQNKTNNSCTDINECDGFPCDHICTNTIGSFLCSCDKGFKPKGTKCYDINECEVKDLNNCDQKCRNTEGSFACECYDGYELNDTTRNTCYSLPTSVNCTNVCNQLCIVEDNKAVCSCFQGYYLNDTDCIDIDECESNPCVNGNCTNKNGTFSCSCRKGTKLLEDKLTCEECISGKYGYDCAANCSCNTTNTKPQICFAENGTCDCLTGWTGSDCSTDVDECNQSTNSCPANSKCVNSPGSFRCVCEVGYFKSANFCLSCENNHYGQDCNQKCKCLQFGINTDSCDNVNGQCRCKPGWTGSSCETDIDECLNTSYCPDIHESCFNLNGSVECRCIVGYHRINGSLCKDIDECLDPLNRCNFSTTICNNTDGSYVCDCRPGHIDINDTATCKVNYKKFPLEIEFDFSQQNLSSLIFIITTTESKDLQRKIARSLTKFSKEKYGDAVLSFEIYNLTNGSVIAHTNLQIDLLNTNISDYVASSFAFELSKAKNFTIGDDIVTIMDVKVQNVSTRSIKDQCELYQKLSTCQPGQVCQTSSVPECTVVTSKPQANENDLIIGLSVGFGLFVILVIAIAIIIVLHIKRKRMQRDQSSVPSNDRESISEILSKSIATRKPLGYQSLYSPEAYLQPGGYNQQREGQYNYAGVLDQSGFSSDEPGPTGHSHRRRSRGSDLGLSEETEQVPDRSTSRFSWSHMINLLDQHKGFTIKRPTIDSIPELRADSPKAERNKPS
ncbi:fibrillin-1-like [Physella acuta]|uniref:fibrillin-1-like n=1 Tax=Physella acuta TaxID=109671 RepID=UPI0027DC99A2|nr:fibrillin-1-like [Physella acuta]